MSTLDRAADAIRPAPPAPSVRRRAATRRAVRTHSRSFAVAAIAPISGIYGVLIAVPALLAAVLSFTTWNGLGAPQWAGLGNWVEFVQDSRALHSLLTTLGFAAGAWVAQVPISLFLGLFISGEQRYRKVYSVLFAIPMLLSSAGVALAWSGILDPNFGGIAYLGQHLHLPFLIQNWLGSVTLTPVVMVFLASWQFIPMNMIIFQNGRRAIPSSMYEAAEIDGASLARQFFSVTLPQMRHTINTVSVLAIVGSLTYFDLMYFLTNGGPGTSTDVLALEMYKVAFQQNDYGYAGVFAVVLGGIGVAVGLIMNKLSGFDRFESEQEGVA